MNTFLRRLLNYDTMDQLVVVAHEQQLLLAKWQHLCEVERAETERIKIEYSRWGRDIISGFLVILDKPEEQEELRDTLHQALIDMSDEVARLEEHAPR